MLAPGQVIDRYTVDRLLGQGGMAVVYRVTHNQLGSFHALKVLTLSNPGIRQRLLQEGRVQASLRHGNVVTVTDVIDVDGAPGLVMEYVDGPSLDAWLQTHRPTLEESERLFRGIVAGVMAAHEQGLVHRDLKPANVLLAPASGGSHVPKVADFGLAKAFQSDEAIHKTRSGVTMGTPAYMAPEQIRDAKNVDHRADVFSLGCILYELACGRPPFTGPDVLSIFNAVASGSYPAPTSVAPGLPQRIQDAIGASLQVDRDARLANCAMLLGLLDGQPVVLATPPEKATYDPDTVEQALQGASLSPPEPSEPPKRRFRVRWPGRRKSSSGSHPPTRMERLFVPLFVAPLIVLGALGAVSWWSWNVLATRWDGRARQALVEKTGGEIAYGDSWVRPWGVTMDDVVVLGSDGDPLVEVARLRIRGGWSWRAGFQPRDVRLDGAVFHPRRANGTWVLPDRTLATLRAQAADGRSLSIRKLSTGPVRIEATSPAGTLKGFVERVVLTGVVLLPAEGQAWTAKGLDIGHVAFDAGDPILDLRGAKLEDGVLVVDGAEAWLRLRPDGLVDLPPVVQDSLPTWFGGTDRDAQDEEWFGLRMGLWPVDVTRLDVRSGEIHVYDRAHAPKAQQWDLELDHVGVGPIAEGWLPIDAAASISDARVTFEGDVRADGMFRGRLGLRHLPVSQFAPYLDADLRHHRIEPLTGTLGGDIDFTLKRDSFAGRVEVSAENVAFATLPPSPGAPQPSPAAVKLTIPRERTDAEAELIGSLDDPDFRPTDEAIAVMVDALMAPTGERTRTRMAARYDEPTPSPRPSSIPEKTEEAIRSVDRVRREVLDVFDEFGKTGRGERHD